MRKTQTILRTYDGTKLEVVGKALLDCERNGKSFKLLFYVIKGNLNPLLSARTCLDQGFIKCCSEKVQFLEVEKKNGSTLLELKTTYKSTFEGL